MSFPLTLNGVVFNDHDNGLYVADGVGFNDPTNQIILRPSTVVRKNNTRDISLTRRRQWSNTDGALETAIVTVNIVTPSAGVIGATELAAMLSDCAAAGTEDVIDGMLLGNS